MTAAGFARLADDLAGLPGRVMPRAAAIVEDIATDEARRATGNGRMSGMGRRGPRLRAVTARPAVRGQTTTVTVRGVPAGPWSILTSGARPHAIEPSRRGGVMAGGLRHPVGGRVRHGGMAGKGTWRRVLARAGRDVPPLFADEVHRAVR